MTAAAFHLPVWFDLGATFAFGLTGAIAGIKRGYDIVGVFFLALASGIGGGLLRDVITRKEPLVFKPGQFYVLTALAGAVVFVFLAVMLDVAATPAAGAAIARSRSRSTGGPPRSAGRARKT